MQRFARHVEIKREPQALLRLLKSGVGLGLLKIAAREGPISRAAGSPSPTLERGDFGDGARLRALAAGDEYQIGRFRHPLFPFA